MAQLVARCADNAEVFGSIPNIRSGVVWCGVVWCGVCFIAFVAQSVERVAVNHKVIGSSPVGGVHYNTYFYLSCNTLSCYISQFVSRSCIIFT